MQAMCATYLNYMINASMRFQVYDSPRGMDHHPRASAHKDLFGFGRQSPTSRFPFLPSILGNPVCNRNDNAHGKQGNILVSTFSKKASCTQF